MLRIAPGLELPAAEACVQTIAMIAKRGAGKTFTALKLIEELLAADQVVVVIDPVGVCWGLRSSADGKGPGFPVLVFGGSHGDLPLEAAAGELLADLVVDERRSCVLDLSELRKGESVRFMIDFAERLYHRNREPLHVVLDEADAFAPQKPMTGTNEARMLGAIEDLVRRGRARGIGLTMTTQRAAVLNKNVLTQCEVLVTLRTISPQDRKAVEAWIEIHGTTEQRAEMLASLAALPNGVAWWWSPWRDLFLKTKASARRTYDSSATPTGHQPATPRKMAEVDLEALGARLKEVAERAKASDPKLLQKRVAELQRELTAARAAAPAHSVKTVEVPILKDRDTRRLAAVAKILERRADQVEQAAGVVRAIQQDLAEKLKPLLLPKPAALAAGLLPPTSRPAPRAAAVEGASLARMVIEPQRAINGAATPGAGEARVLKAVAQYGDEGATRETITVLTGYKRSSRDAYLQRLGSQGLIERSGDRLVATLAGVRALGSDFEPLPTGEALKDYWLARLPEGERKILKLLLFNRGGLTREAISENTPYKRSSRDAYLQRMSARRVVVYSGRLVLPAPEFFA